MCREKIDILGCFMFLCLLCIRVFRAQLYFGKFRNFVFKLKCVHFDVMANSG